MPTFTETKKEYEALLQKLNDMNLRELRVESFASLGTTISGTQLILRASNSPDTDRGVNIRFDGVGHIQLPTRVAYFTMKLAHPNDARPLETDLSMTLNPPIWVISIEVEREGGDSSVPKYLIAAEKMQIEF